MRIFCTLFLAIATLASDVDAKDGQPKTDQKPNIVFILADDLGFGDVSFHNRNILKKDPYVETPHIDARFAFAEACRSKRRFTKIVCGGNARAGRNRQVAVEFLKGSIDLPLATNDFSNS